ncbi:hypothetical protein KHQ81_11610 [Mycoplasmatota bacterium]|nr:hypothetical protein KHQ81_11610 [Mycoplasmatota bacterium]
MIRKNKLLYLIPGFIFSIILYGYFNFVYSNAMKADILKELSFYYQSMGEKNLSNGLMTGYYLFQYSLLFAALLLIPMFKLINNSTIKNNIFYLQFGFIWIIGEIIFSYKEYLMNINSKNILFLILCVIILFFIIKTSVNEFRGKKTLHPYEELNQFEKLYYLLIIGLYFFIINKFHNLSDLFCVSMLIISFIVTLYLPYFLKERIKIKSFIFYKPLIFIMLITVTILFINSSFEYNKYTSYYNELPNNFILNKNTTFDESKSVLGKNCELSNDGVRCSISHNNKIFNDYYFDTATIRINSAAVEQLNNSDYKLKLYFFYCRNKDDYNQDVIIIDDFITTKSEDGNTFTIDLKNYLSQYKIKEYDYISLTLYFIDEDTDKSLSIDLSDYQITLTKY